MYITRAIIDGESTEAYRLSASPYRVHALVEAVCNEGEPPAEAGRNLWRLDNVGDNLHLYIVSPKAPDIEGLAARVGEPASQVLAKRYDSRLERLKNGQLWQFRLKANPVRKVLVDKGRVQRDGIVGTIQGMVTEDQQVQWLMDRQEKLGIRVVSGPGGCPQVALHSRRKEQFKRGDGVVTLVTVVYDGVVEVTDCELFKHALCCGIGRAKGFGCGLMTIASVGRG